MSAPHGALCRKRPLPAGAARALAVLLSAAAAASPAIHAVGWPVEKPVVVGTFGEDRGDHFNQGLDIGGAGQSVHPVLDGELVFRWDGPQDWSSVPRGTGSIVVLRHGQNILSLYAHLAEGTLGPARASYTTGDTIGQVGDSGRAGAAQLAFSLYDGEARTWVNPLAFLPPVPDHQLPVIRRVVLAVGDQRQAMENGSKVKEGRTAILAEVYDLREDVRFHWPLAPYILRLVLDGTQVARVSFDTLSVRGGLMTLGPAGLTRDDLYAGDGLLNFGTLDLRAGESRLLIAASDYAGNETVREAAISVAAQQ